MRKVFFALVALVALFMLCSNVAAATNWGVGATIDGLYIQVQKENGKWYALAHNHYRNVDGWYYFNMPYRYFHGGTYHYFEPGWYNYAPGWVSYPYARNYTYYPRTYYRHYGSWYYNPYWYNWPAAEPVIAYMLPKPKPKVAVPSAQCSDVELRVQDVKVRAGQGKIVKVRVENDSHLDMEIMDMEVYVDAFRVSAGDLQKPKYVGSYRSENAGFRVNADEHAEGKYNANVKVAVQFADGKYCSYSAVGAEEFTIDVEPEEYEEQGSESVIVYHEEEEEVQVNGLYVPDNAIEFSSGLQPQCRDLDIVVKNFTVQSGKLENEHFWVKNFTSQDFYIDSIIVQESSNNLSMGVRGSDGIVYEGSSTGRVSVWADAFPVENDDYTRGYVKVTGHFEKGLKCTIGEEFYVYINTDNFRCEGLSLEIDEVVETYGDEAAITVKFDNPTLSTGHVTIVAERADVSLGEITTEPETYAERIIYLSDISEEGAKVKFNAFAGNCTLLQKYTTVVKKEVEVPNPPHKADFEVVHIPTQIHIEKSNEPKDFSIILKNLGSGFEDVKVEVAGLPEGIYTRAIERQFGPEELRVLELEVLTNNADKGIYSGTLIVRSEGYEISQEVQFIVGDLVSAISGVQNKAENTPEEGENTGSGSTGSANQGSDGDIIAGVNSFAGAAFLTLGANVYALGALVLILIAIFAIYIYFSRKGRKLEVWAA